jgi:hypothetical protein
LTGSPLDGEARAAALLQAFELLVAVVQQRDRCNRFPAAVATLRPGVAVSPAMRARRCSK